MPGVEYGELLSSTSSVLVMCDLCLSCRLFTVALKKVKVSANCPRERPATWVSLVHIAFAMEMWLHLPHPHDYCLPGP